MIRDPSDGSVRDAEARKHEALKRQQEEMRECNLPTPENSVPAEYTSGLQTGSTKPENLARLEKSREWMKEFNAKKGQV